MKTQAISKGAIFLILAALPIVLEVVGCAEKAAEDDSITNPEIGVVDDAAGFYVRARKSADYTYYTHRGAQSGYTPATYAGSLDRTSDCVAKAGEDIMCYVEGAEYDLYYNGVVLQHNIPSTLCTYAEIVMPFYMARPAGNGPSVASYEDQTLNGTRSVVDVQNTAQGVPYCPFDYSAGNGPNCCEGSFTLNVKVVVSPLPTAMPVSPPPSKQSWGGQRSSCANGPAMDLMKKGTDGFPLSDVMFIRGVGINGVYEIPSPMSKLARMVYVANYFDIPTTKNYGQDFTSEPSIEVSGTPIVQTNFFYPAGMRQEANPYLAGTTAMAIPASSPAISSTGFSAGINTDPYYQYTCYNSFKEVTARIRVMVRAWDIVDLLPSGTSTLPDYVRTNGSETGAGAGTSLHDFMTWGDLFFKYTAPRGPTGIFTSESDGFPFDK